MDWQLIAVLALLTFGLAVAIRQIQTSWSSATPPLAVPAGVGSSSPKLRQHYRRASPAVILGGTFMVLAGWALAFHANTIGAVLGIIAIVIILIVYPAVILFNHPKFLVQPVLRNQKGLLSRS